MKCDDVATNFQLSALVWTGSTGPLPAFDLLLKAALENL